LREAATAEAGDLKGSAAVGKPLWQVSGFFGRSPG
jgi:hypothetical protein